MWSEKKGMSKSCGLTENVVLECCVLNEKEKEPLQIVGMRIFQSYEHGNIIGHYRFLFFICPANKNDILTIESYNGQ